jgi:chromosome segregation ATPase
MNLKKNQAKTANENRKNRAEIPTSETSNVALMEFVEQALEDLKTMEKSIYSLSEDRKTLEKELHARQEETQKLSLEIDIQAHTIVLIERKFSELQLQISSYLIGYQRLPKESVDFLLKVIRQNHEFLEMPLAVAPSTSQAHN